MGRRNDPNNKNNSLYQKWNALTATCYRNKMNCKTCWERGACQLGRDNNESKNKYNMLPIKYVTLMTYANVGKKGLEKYGVMDEKQVTSDKEG